MASKDTISITFKIKDVDGGFKELSADAESFRKAMTSAIEEAEKLKSSAVNFAAVATGITAANNSLNQLVSLINSVTTESAEFSKAMHEANTMAGKDAAGFDRLKSQVADLAKEIPIARDLLANGLYQTISNGVPEDNWIEYLKTSARSAVGGLADINKVVGVTATLIKNYGLEWSAAAEIQDKIQFTAKNGVTSFEQLAQALPRVAGNAATLGVSVDELMGTFATLTGVSGNTAEVSTQLAAIFTALVKPSSDAAKMAAEMGIQFDAAAIKAAGGFQNFLSQLNKSVKTYSESAGVLEQEVYGRLFSSAEALRALVPLQGELADKFSDNIANMVGSAGTMDAAFAEMSNTSEAAAQKMSNSWAWVKDNIFSFTSKIQPLLDWGEGVFAVAANTVILANGLKALNIQSKIAAGKTLAANGIFKILCHTSKKTALGLEMLGAAAGKAARQSELLKIGVRGLLITTGVGVAIAAVTAIISHFSDTAEDAAESSKKLDDATEDYTRAAADAKVKIDEDIRSLGELIKTGKDTSEAVQHLNETYGELFGNHKTAQEWYDILRSKSQAYIKQIGYEAQAKSLAAKIAEVSINKELAAERKADLERAGKHKTTQTYTVGGGNTGYVQTYTAEVETEEYKQAKKDIAEAEAAEAELQKRLNVVGEKVAEVSAEISQGMSAANSAVKVNEMTWQQCSDAIDKTEKSLKSTTDKGQIKELRAYNEQLKARKKLLESITGIGSGNGKADKPKAQAGSVKYISEEIDKIRSKIDLTVDPASRAALYKELEKLELQKRRIEFEYKFPDKVEKPDIMPDLGKIETDITKIKPEIVDVSDAFSDTGDEAKMTTAAMADGFGDLFSSLSGLGSALELPELNVAGTMAQAVATMVASFASAWATTGPMGPLAWLAFGATGLAQLTAIVSSVKSLPAFANGGIVSGPTVGLIGEYAGASNNPEVIAPLDKLRGMLNPVGAPVIVGGTLRASGRDLVCVLANETRIASKSGQRTNIKL